MSLDNPVRTLNPEVARKIAAGEVIDRPNAIIRELMDNAVDSGASKITVEINGGGIDKIRVIDNGCGMTKEDLQNCARPHATSKISTEIDLMNLTTLGFRGEALASIAAVSRLTISSGQWKMQSSITEDHLLEPSAEYKGTIVQSEGLFENFPARRQFLKRPATEALMCKNTFIEKAMAKPQIAFTLIQDGQQKINLPENQSLKDRFIQANSYLEDSALFFPISYKGQDFSFDVILGEPAVSRSNKKDIFIYTNGRKIQEYSLVQAVEYGGQGFFPNGTYPVAAVFININPNLVDFNIHPAKREARFYDISELHHALSSTIKNFYRQYTRQNFEEGKSLDDVREFDFNQMAQIKSNFSNQNQTSKAGENSPNQSENKSFAEAHFDFNNLENLGGGESQENKRAPDNNLSSSSNYTNHIQYKNNYSSDSSFNDFRSKYLGLSKGTGNKSSENMSSANLAQSALFASGNLNANEKTSNITYVGKCLGTFLLAEKNNVLYFIDQHAAHERIIFDKLMASQGKTQELLIPYKIKTESKNQDKQMEKLSDGLKKIGFNAVKIEDGEWHITSIPERWTGSEYDLRSLLFVKQVEPEEIIRSIAAMTACKAAIKDGYVIDDDAAKRIIEKTFELDDPHCPHGRPIYTVISREKLFELVKRT
ncbi:MAG: DNA mismatch repair endonuclease MutL [Treponema sp.]|nr:DNA mismatch repair endonuclease MutL [Treponema sp.]